MPLIFRQGSRASNFIYYIAYKYFWWLLLFHELSGHIYDFYIKFSLLLLSTSRLRCLSYAMRFFIVISREMPYCSFLSFSHMISHLTPHAIASKNASVASVLIDILGPIHISDWNHHYQSPVWWVDLLSQPPPASHFSRHFWRASGHLATRLYLLTWKPCATASRYLRRIFAYYVSHAFAGRRVLLRLALFSCNISIPPRHIRRQSVLSIDVSHCHFLSWQRISKVADMASDRYLKCTQQPWVSLTIW